MGQCVQRRLGRPGVGALVAMLGVTAALPQQTQPRQVHYQAPPVSFEEWVWEDPGGDAQQVEVRRGEVLRVVVPGKGNDFDKDSNFGAPRKLAYVYGDFAVQAQVSAEPLRYYQGAGILAYMDPDLYVRLEKNASSASGIAGPGVCLEVRQDTGYWSAGSMPTDAPTLYLRLERTGPDFLALVSPDGQRWTELGALHLPEAPRAALVGIVACAEHDAPVFPVGFGQCFFDDHYVGPEPFALPFAPAQARTRFRDEFEKEVQAGWIWEDPDQDCESSLDPDTASLHLHVPVAEKPHVLAKAQEGHNAPRLVVKVRGDFVAQTRVTVSGEDWPTAAGLLVYSSHDVLAAMEVDLRPVLESWRRLQEGRPQSGWWRLPTGAIELRMARRGPLVLYYWRAPEAQGWEPLVGSWLPLTPEAYVGLYAVNEAGDVPCDAYFDYFELLTWQPQL